MDTPTKFHQQLLPVFPVCAKLMKHCWGRSTQLSLVGLEVNDMVALDMSVPAVAQSIESP